ncbi:Phosphatidylethanolamine N-methyltransferase [Smittium mucronatum]|uniref:Phosphatidylethanolamine N-methyltransferase n=1 Tax=Smittium mucronatum TaxID=133383 RepID=A0A1R0H1I7_9FUNG|nr:Phosphatidylethanolamine N-methyltransferase [Smittium mucronatum]
MIRQRKVLPVPCPEKGSMKKHPAVSVQENPPLPDINYDINPDANPDSNPADLLIGSTPNGFEFAVPKTKSFIHSLFNLDFSKKSAFDYFTLFNLFCLFAAYFLFHGNQKRLFFGISFAFWRISYNFGIGYLLHWQSQRQGLVALYKRYFIKTKGKDHPRLWIRSQLEKNMGPDYNFEDVAPEFNTWLLFRNLVDLVLLCDFTSYFFFVLSFAGSGSKNAEWWQVFLRYFGGSLLIVFNLWVKIDAHRVVKDYAWYWGDFFFKVKQWLIFDGVFEIAPHPMYSIGYTGYYGASLITGSYTIFFASVLAHITQFLFLIFVEDPHIEKTYEKPPSIDEVVRINKIKIENLDHSIDPSLKDVLPDSLSSISNPITDINSNILRKDLVGIVNISLFRSVDALTILLLIYSFIIPVIFAHMLNYSLDIHQTLLNFSIINCLFWILIRSLGIGLVLKYQSQDQWWTKWFIKRGGSLDEAFQSWKSLYNTSIVMSFSSFLLIAIFVHKWSGGTPLSLHIYENEQFQDTVFRMSLGMILMGLQFWCSNSIYESIGSFGWYYGDFFVPLTNHGSRKLLYKGVYRYLNNPEKFLGQTAFFGLSLISGSWLVFALALFLQISLWIFYSSVEAPHMKKLYGEQVRTVSGVTLGFKRAIQDTPLVKLFTPSLEKKDDDSSINKDSLTPEFQKTEQKGARKDDSEYSFGLESNKKSNKSGRPYRLSAGSIADFVNETKELFRNAKERLKRTNAFSEVEKIERLEDYKFDLIKGNDPQEDESNNVYDLGEPIHISWEAPVTHSRKDWVGIYKITSNFFPHVSTVSSQGNYVYIHPDDELLTEFVNGDCFFTGNALGVKSVKGKEDDGKLELNVFYGDAVFSGDSLPWEEGTYEMRLHHGYTHYVISSSKPFEIKGNLLFFLIYLCIPITKNLKLYTCHTIAQRPDKQIKNLDLDYVDETFPKIVNRCLSVTITKRIRESDVTESELDAKTEANSEPKKGSQDIVTNGVCKGHDPNTYDRDLVLCKTEIVGPLKALDDPIGISGELEESMAKRLAGCIEGYFKMDYSYEVLVTAAKNGLTVREVGLHIYKGRKALDDFAKIQAESLVSCQSQENI